VAIGPRGRSRPVRDQWARHSRPWRASGAATRNPDMAIFWPFMSRLQISVFLLRREIVLTGVSIYQE
jgi:hypothetical protein